MSLGIWELVVILAIVALLFGTKKLGSLGTDIGNAIKGFRTAVRDDEARSGELPSNRTAERNNKNDPPSGSDRGA